MIVIAKVKRLFHRCNIRIVNSLVSTVVAKEFEPLDDVVVTCVRPLEGVIIKVASIRNMVNTISKARKLNEVTSQLAAEALACNILLASGLKEGQYLQTNFSCCTGANSITTCVNDALECQLMTSSTAFPLLQDVSIVAPLIPTELVFPNGILQTTTYHPSWKSPIVGMVPLQSGAKSTIASNIVMYLQQSAQRQATLMTIIRKKNVESTSADKKHELDRLAEGNGNSVEFQMVLGIYIEALPECNTESSAAYNHFQLCKTVAENLEQRLQLAPNFPSMRGFVEEIVGVPLVQSDLHTMHPVLSCSCSMDRMWRSLALYPKEELEELLRSQDSISVTCQLCGHAYHASRVEIYESILKPT